MTQLKKEEVLQEFTQAYKQAEGKQPDIAEKNGWYSVNGGKNMRLKNLAAWTEELQGGKSPGAASANGAKTTGKASQSGNKKGQSATTKSSKTKTSKSSGKKSPAAKGQAAQAAGYRVKSQGKGQTAQELWRERLAEQDGKCRLPRGLQS